MTVYAPQSNRIFSFEKVFRFRNCILYILEMHIASLRILRVNYNFSKPMIEDTVVLKKTLHCQHCWGSTKFSQTTGIKNKIILH